MGHGFRFQGADGGSFRGVAVGVGQDFVDHGGQAFRVQIRLVEIASTAQFDGVRDHVGIADPGNEDGAGETRTADDFPKPVGACLAVAQLVIEQQHVVGRPVEVRRGLAQTQARVLRDLHARDLLVEENMHGFQGNFAIVDQQNFHGSTDG